MERLTEVPQTSTKERILDAAERLFAERGFGETSLRDITATAGVNLAAVNYHFQSKDALIQAVFGRRLSPINEARLNLLDEVERAAGDRALPVEAVLRAFLAPLYHGDCASARFVYFKRLMGRMYADPGDLFAKIFRDQFGRTAERFMAAFRRALPFVPPVDLLWRMHFTIGALAHTMGGLHHLEVISNGACDPLDTEGTLERLVTFLAAGLRAPAGTASQGGTTCDSH